MVCGCGLWSWPFIDPAGIGIFSIERLLVLQGSHVSHRHSFNQHQDPLHPQSDIPSPSPSPFILDRRPTLDPRTLDLHPYLSTIHPSPLVHVLIGIFTAKLSSAKQSNAQESKVHTRGRSQSTRHKQYIPQHPTAKLPPRPLFVLQLQLSTFRIHTALSCLAYTRDAGERTT